jgi:hypothetical protein
MADLAPLWSREYSALRNNPMAGGEAAITDAYC